ncbi:uncharacterized protein [Elaeis guineensis]|uniref:uncharacterized protein n=1 Tax=Elaeis guineensis var. tenera TaxID=51953 RepID=UPI003C6D1FC4
MKRMGLSGVDAYAKFYQNKSGEFVTKEARQRHEKMLELREQATREVGSDGDTGSQQVCLMTDDTILDTVLGRQLGSDHSMRSKKSRSSSSGRSDDASVPEAVRTSMSMMQDQISYWMNRSQTLERIVAAVAGRLGIDASELVPLQSHHAASAPPSRHISGVQSVSGVTSASGVMSASGGRMPDDSVSDDRMSDAFWGTQIIAQRRFCERGALSGVPSGMRIAAGALIRNCGLFRHVSKNAFVSR